MSGIYNNKVENRLQRIANVLLLNASFTDNLGLLNGKMGIAIFFFQYARYTGNKVYKDFAGELIDEIYGEINNSTPLGFANGLMGIGWGIEYLVRNGYLEADTDEALAEIDNAVYRSSLHRPFLLDNGDDLFGYGLYYVTRLMGREDDDDNLKTLFKKQHLIYLTDDCERILVQKQYKNYNIDSLSTDTIISFIWFLIEMHRLGLFPVKVENILRSLPEYIRQGLETANDELAKTLLILLTDKVVSFVNDLDTRNTLKTILEQKANWEKVMGVSDEALTYNFIKGSYQLLIYGPLPGFIELTKKQAKNVFLVIDEEGNWNNRLDNLKNENIGFTGLAGLGMGLLLSINGPYNIKKRSMPKATSNII
jgi:hypothetical protein